MSVPKLVSNITPLDQISKINEVIDNLVVVDQTYDASSTNPQSGTAVADAISTKQDTIEDLETIRAGATAGSTALQPSSVTSTYSATGTAPVNGTAVDSALANSGFITGIDSEDVTTALGYTPENVSNKVASLSALSTDIQYPSAKLMYSQLNAKQSALIAGTNLEIVGATTHSLPSGYTEVESLQSVGAQYIDTGLKVDSNDWGFRAIVTPANDSDMGAIGSITPSSNENRFFGIRTRDNSSFVYGFGGYFSASANQSYVNVKTVIELNYLDSLKAKIGTSSADLTRTNDIISGYNIRLFGISDSLTWSGVGYEFWITKGQNIVGHYIPARRNSDNKLGVYDLISNEFLLNQGSGDFVAGNNVVSTINFVNNSGFITSSDLGSYVPTSTQINGKALSGDITLTASDVNALPSSTSIPTITFIDFTV